MKPFEVDLKLISDRIDHALELNWNITSFKDSYSTVNLVECKAYLVLAKKRLASIRKKEGFT